MRRVVVHIDSLVLKGFRPEDRHGIARGLQERLTNLLSAPDMARKLEQLESVPTLRAGNMNIAVDARPEQVGASIANKLGKGFAP